MKKVQNNAIRQNHLGVYRNEVSVVFQKSVAVSLTTNLVTVFSVGI